jgi:tetratricopeptide (TPR) repeat protein
MALESKPPEAYELVREWAFYHFGIAGLIAIAVLVAAFSVYKNWDKVKIWPGIASLLAYWRRWPVPQADPSRFSILVAHLENDAQSEHERLILEALKEFEGVQTLSLDRTIPLAGSVPEEMEKQGQEEAQSYLKESGASVLIWGAVLSRGGSAVYKIYWTTATGGERKPERYAAPLAEEQLRLPEVFWGDLAEILRLQVISGAVEFEAHMGHYVADRLSPFITRVRRLLKASADRLGWDADARGTTLVILANSLSALGEQSGQNKPLEEAVAAYREALTEYNRERVPLDWAATQNNLANALRKLGEREGGPQRLEEAVAAYGEALKEYTRERVPLHWAATQNNLGTALARLGEQEGSTQRLEEAVAAYREALKEYTREQVPLHWAMTQNNLGFALRSLGERESGTKRLEEAVAAYREALKERTREQVPLDWAATQNNLGFALTRLGKRETGTALLEGAVKAYKAALEIVEPAEATYYVEMFKANLQEAEALLQKRRK